MKSLRNQAQLLSRKNWLQLTMSSLLSFRASSLNVVTTFLTFTDSTVPTETWKKTWPQRTLIHIDFDKNYNCKNATIKRATQYNQNGNFYKTASESHQKRLKKQNKTKKLVTSLEQATVKVLQMGWEELWRGLQMPWPAMERTALMLRVFIRCIRSQAHMWKCSI